MHYLMKWIDPTQQHYSWLDIEQSECGELCIGDLPHLGETLKKKGCYNSMGISTT